MADERAPKTTRQSTGALDSIRVPVRPGGPDCAGALRDAVSLHLLHRMADRAIGAHLRRSASRLTTPVRGALSPRSPQALGLAQGPRPWRRLGSCLVGGPGPARPAPVARPRRRRNRQAQPAASFIAIPKTSSPAFAASTGRGAMRTSSGCSTATTEQSTTINPPPVNGPDTAGDTTRSDTPEAASRRPPLYTRTTSPPALCRTSESPGIPLFWQLIDCSFGIIGIVPLYLAHRTICRPPAFQSKVA